MSALFSPGVALFNRTGILRGYAFTFGSFAFLWLAGLLVPAAWRWPLLLPLWCLAVYLAIALRVSIALAQQKVAALFGHYIRGEWQQDIGDFSAKRAKDNIVLIAHDLGKHLGKVTGQLQESVDHVSGHAAYVATQTGQLASRAEEIAAMLEETASGMEEFAASIERNAANCKEASERARDAHHAGEEAQTKIKALSETAYARQASRQRVHQAVDVIENIAFQTNMLALNAAMEAARVGTAHGEAGRGFGVVATQVRELAQKSADAVGSIRNIVKEVAEQEQEALASLQQGEAAIAAIVSRAADTSRIIGDIAAASSEQHAGISQIKMAIEHMATLTQQNAAAVDDTTATARALSHESGTLMSLLSGYLPSGYEDRHLAVTTLLRGQELIRQLGLAAACEVLADKHHAFFAAAPQVSVSVIRMDGTLLANSSNPASAGQSILGQRDIHGHPYVQATIDNIRKSGSTWIEYATINRKTGVLETKLGYSERVEGQEIWLNCAVFRREDAPVVASKN